MEESLCFSYQHHNLIVDIYELGRTYARSNRLVADVKYLRRDNKSCADRPEKLLWDLPIALR